MICHRAQQRVGTAAKAAEALQCEIQALTAVKAAGDAVRATIQQAQQVSCRSP